MEQVKTRIEWVDIYKGLAILFMVIGHFTGFFNPFIYQFHMAAFFFISGYTSNIEKKTLAKTIYDKMWALLIPFFTIFILLLIFVWGLNKIGWYEYLFADPFFGVKQTIKTLLFNGDNYVFWMGAGWFVIVLFGVFVIQKSICLILGNKISVGYIITSTLVFLLGYYFVKIGYVPQFSIFDFDLIFIGQLYFSIGVVTKRYEILEKFKKHIPLNVIAFICNIALLFYFSKIESISVDYPARQFGNPALNAIAAINGIVFCYFISILIEKTPRWIRTIMTYLGTNTLGIVFFQFMFLKLGFLGLYLFGIVPIEYLKNVVPTTEIGNRYWPLFVAISVLCSLLLWKILMLIPLLSLLLGKDRAFSEKIWNRICSIQWIRKVIIWKDATIKELKSSVLKNIQKISGTVVPKNIPTNSMVRLLLTSYKYQYVISGILIILTTFIWYQNNHWSVLMGDDIIAAFGYRDLGFWGNLLNPADLAMGKIRPISKILLYFAYVLSGMSYEKYYLCTRICLSVVSVVIYYVLRKMDIDSIKSFIIAIILITCPFSAYGVWQYIGICESFSLLCCVMCGYYTYKLFYESEVNKVFRNVLLCTMWFAFLILNGERFMYLAAAIVLAIFLKNDLKIRNKMINAGLIIAPIFIRSIMLNLLGSDALGTGRVGIWTLISTLVPYAIRGYVNMLGFSIGEDWHGGFDIIKIAAPVLILSSIRVFIFLGVLYSSIQEYVIKKSKKSLEIIIWYVFSLTSLFSYALVASTHGEDRFIWVSYMFYLFGLSRYITEKLKENRTKRNKSYSKTVISVVTIICFSMLVASNYYYLVNKTHVYYRYSQEMAETAIENVRLLEGYDNVENIACVKSGDYLWVFGNQIFFKNYINSNVNVYYYDTLEDLNADLNALGERTIVIYPDSNHPIPYGVTASWINDFSEEI